MTDPLDPLIDLVVDAALTCSATATTCPSVATVHPGGQPKWFCGLHARRYLSKTEALHQGIADNAAEARAERLAIAQEKK